MPFAVTTARHAKLGTCADGGKMVCWHLLRRLALAWRPGKAAWRRGRPRRRAAAADLRSEAAACGYLSRRLDGCVPEGTTTEGAGAHRLRSGCWCGYRAGGACASNACTTPAG